MANTVAITIKVSDEDANRKLQNMQRQLDRLKGSSTGGGGNPFAGLASGARGAHSATVELALSSRNLREALHAVHPALEQLGLGFSNFAGLGASARASIGIFAAALLGTLVVALEKAADAAAKTNKTLSDLGATPAQIERVKAFSRESGISASTLAEQSKRVREGQGATFNEVLPDYFPQGPGSGRRGEVVPAGLQDAALLANAPSKVVELINKATDIAAGVRGGGGADAETITRALKEHGGLNAEDIGNLSAGGAAQIAKALGVRISPTTDQQPLTPNVQLQNYLGAAAGPGARFTEGSIRAGLARSAPQIDQEYSKLPEGLDAAVGKVKESLRTLADEIGKSGLSKALSDLAGIINSITGSNLSKGLHAIAHPLETAIILAGKAKTQEEAEAKARYITGEGAAPAPAAPSPIPPGPDYIRLTLRRNQWQKDHPGEPLPEGYAGGGPIPRFAAGGPIDDLLLQLARKRTGLPKIGNAQNVGLGPILDLFKLASPFLHGAGMAGGGLLDGPGTETSDSILIRASKGEGVLNARAVRAIGKSGLDYLNSLDGFADGGLVDGFGGSGGSDGGSSTSSSGPANELHLHFDKDRAPVVAKVDGPATLEAIRSEAALSSLVQIVPRQSYVR